MPVTTHSDLSTGAGVGVGGAEVVDVGGTVEAGVVDVVGGKGVVVGGGAGSSVVVVLVATSPSHKEPVTTNSKTYANLEKNILN